MALRIFTSNRTEVLLDQLAGVLRDSPPDPLVPETIVVQSRGMEKWLCHRLAEELGSWASFRFPFPNAVLRFLQEALLGPLPDPAPFAGEVLAWRILDLFSHPEAAAHPELARYLGSDPGSLKAFQLALRVADAFDQYSLYRPEKLAHWERGGGDGEGQGIGRATGEGALEEWQGWLWRRLAEGREGEHRAALLRAFLREADRVPGPPPGFPPRLSLFGIPALPPYHLEAFLASSRLCQVNIFLLNPCREYWTEIRSPSSIDRLRLEYASGELPGEEHHEIGHPLLASLGRQGREFLDLLLGSPVVPGFAGERWVEPGESSLLGALQGDILALRRRGVEGEKTPLRPGDLSLTLHSCHGPLREVEVLCDQLCRLFAADPSLRPRDVLVMAPESRVDEFAPLVEAVFAAEPRIPVAVADRSARGEVPLAEAFFRLLDLPRSRVAASWVLDLLRVPEVRRRFSLTDQEISLVGGWVEKTRIRWGVDAASREREGFVPFADNSWRAGLDRLLLGAALDLKAPLEGILPLPVGGSEAAAAGKLGALVEELDAFSRELAAPLPLEAWADLLLGALDRFFSSAHGEGDGVEELRLAASALRSLGRSSAFSTRVPLDVIRHALAGRLAERTSTRSFLSGQATFCALLPMRSIPARVVALVGMDGAGFPRTDSTPSFSLLSPDRGPARRKGDRSLRDEDRYLFLETLLSARDALLILWTGRSARDNSEIQPSVLVAELLDAVEEGFFVPGGPGNGSMRGVLVTQHPLQAFNPSAFDPVSPRSFSQANAGGARALLAARAAQARGGEPHAPPFLAEPLPQAGEERRSLTLDRLVAFLDNPCSFFLRERLALDLPRPEEAPADAEPIEIEGLALYQVRREILEALLAGDERETFARLRARGDLPVGSLGEMAFSRERERLAPFADRLRPLLGQGPPLPFDLSLGAIPAPWRLTGSLGPLGPRGAVFYRPASIKGKDLLRAWVHHLALNAAGGGHPLSTHIRSPDEELVFPPLSGAPSAEILLAGLLDLYWEGLRRPLPLFPRSSRAWAENGPAGGGTAETGERQARERWSPTAPRRGEQPGECRDPAIRACFGEADPVGTLEFRILAERLFTPLLSALGQEGKKS